MMIKIKKMLPQILLAFVAFSVVLGLNLQPAFADSAAEIDQGATTALQTLYAKDAAAKTLGESAKGILIFPKISKAGFIVGGQGGEGVLRKGGTNAGYYRTSAASFGLQAGVQSFSYAMFFMDDESLNYLETSDGWEIGSGPSVVIADEGFGKTMTSTTVKKGVYAFIFGQKGLMAGIGLQGSKITKKDK
jgi:lipid-binding SYLF domain-containing protein